jgi:hypothetical protein
MKGSQGQELDSASFDANHRAPPAGWAYVSRPFLRRLSPMPVPFFLLSSRVLATTKSLHLGVRLCQRVCKVRPLTSGGASKRGGDLVTPEPNDRCQSKKAVGLPRALETGGLMPRCLRSPSPALNSKEHAELAVAATPSKTTALRHTSPSHPHLPAVLPAGKAGTAHGLRSPAQRWWLRRFRTHARLGSFQAFSRTLDASSADAVHTSQGSGADPSFLTPQEGEVEESGVTP